MLKLTLEEEIDEDSEVAALETGSMLYVANPDDDEEIVKLMEETALEIDKL